jgi:hypothetical protein
MCREKTSTQISFVPETPVGVGPVGIGRVDPGVVCPEGVGLSQSTIRARGAAMGP